MNIRRFIDRLFESQVYGYWMDKDGKLTRVSPYCHDVVAGDILNRIWKKAHPGDTEMPYLNPETVYAKMFAMGYARVVMTGEWSDSITVEVAPGQELTRRQLSAARDLGVESKDRVRIAYRNQYSSGRYIYEPDEAVPV